MELFPSTDEETWEFIKRQIDDSDYYLVVIAGRYGSLASDGLSFTEKEYDYARETKKPVLAFVHADRSKIVAGKTELEPGSRAKLDEFIRKVKEKPLVSSYLTAHELGALVLASIIDLKERRPGTGFVRADQAADFKKYAQLLEENAILRGQVAALEKLKQTPFPDGDLPLALKLRLRTGKAVPDETIEVSPTWSEIFLALAELIIRGISEEVTLSYELRQRLAGNARRGKRVEWADDNWEDFMRMKMKLFGRGLVKFEKLHVDGRLHREWHLTEEGQRQYAALTDIRDSRPKAMVTG
jgi:hypothetical protein